jgi:hypothetical protein
MTANRDSKLELDEEKCPSLLLSEPNVELKSQHDFGIYQMNLFAITQLGYLPVAGGMLTMTFFEPSKVSCFKREIIWITADSRKSVQLGTRFFPNNVLFPKFFSKISFL